LRLLFIAFVLFTAAAQAQEFPSKSVRFVTGAAAGSSGDILARVLGEHLGGVWKQPVVIDNRPGGGGTISGQAMTGAPADGHSVWIAAGSYLTITPATMASMPYDLDRDFSTIAFIAEIPLVIAARAGTPFKTLRELIAYAKANPAKVNYAANTPGTFPNLTTEYFSERAGIKMTFVPYKGTAAALQDILGGRLDVAVEGVGPFAAAIKAGQLIPLAVTSEGRDPTLPDVPAVAETIPGFSAIGFYAALVHAKTPEAMSARLSADLRAALAQPAIAKRYADMGFYVKPMSRDEVVAFIKKEREIWGGVVKRTGFAPR
jgi:tripartite-type tricarboxylate transporter receptor subunit TctC